MNKTNEGKPTKGVHFLLGKIMDIEAHEIKATVSSFLFVFILMAAYYIMRPVRDAMASDWSDAEVSFLWTVNFFASFGIVALYGYAISKIKFQRVVPTIYCFFAASFLLFYFIIQAATDRDFVDKAFYVWLSVFSLFHVSVFWSFMSDTFSKAQAKRLFATIAAGASAGALVGPSIPTLFADNVGTDTLMLIASVLLLVPILLIPYLNNLKVTELHNENIHADLSAAKIGGNPFAGFKLFMTNPYLLGIAAFIFLYTMIGSFIYFEQKNLLAEYDRATRTQILGGIDWITNVLTFGLAFFATGRLVKKAGMGITLAFLPFLVIAGLLILAVAPTVTVLLALQVFRRSGNYAVARPAREMLFTEVDRESRFKAKPVIDIVVYRGGDMMTSWLFAGLTTGLGLGIAAMAVIGAVIAAIWAWCGLLLGKAYENHHSESTSEQ